MRRTLPGLLLAAVIATSAPAQTPTTGGPTNQSSLALIAPTPAATANNNQIATTAWANNFVGSSMPLASGKVWIGSVGNIATPQTLSGDCTVSVLGVVTCTQSAGAFTVNGLLTVTGSILRTNIAAPSTPAAGKTQVYVDLTNKVLSSKNDAGVVSNTVVPSTAGANQFATAISAAGVVAYAQPALGNLSSVGTTRAGDVAYWNGSAWVTLAGNNSGTNCFQENASGVPSWAACGGGGSALTVGTTVVNGGPGILSNSSSGGTLVATAPGTGVLTALGVNVGTAGAFVVNGGALGTPSSGVGTNLTGTAAGLTAGNVTTNANMTGDVTSVGNAATLATTQAGAHTWSAINIFSNTTDATLPTNGGVIFSGGIGVTKRADVTNITIASPSGNSIGTQTTSTAVGTYHAGTISATSNFVRFWQVDTTLSATANNDQFDVLRFGLVIDRGAFTGTVARGIYFVPSAGFLDYALFASSTGGKISLGDTTASTTTATGSIVTAGGIGAAGAIYAGSEVVTGAVAVASLPACNAGRKAARHFVTDANATLTAGIGAAVAAGGANNVPVVCDGTSWRIG